jgi:hypothetical protein
MTVACAQFTTASRYLRSGRLATIWEAVFADVGVAMQDMLTQ